MENQEIKQGWLLDYSYDAGTVFFLLTHAIAAQTYENEREQEE